MDPEMAPHPWYTFTNGTGYTTTATAMNWSPVYSGSGYPLPQPVTEVPDPGEAPGKGLTAAEAKVIKALKAEIKVKATKPSSWLAYVGGKQAARIETVRGNLTRQQFVDAAIEDALFWAEDEPKAG